MSKTATKTGRPRIDRSEARSARLHVVLTEAERVEIDTRAAQAGYASLSDFVRDMCLRRRLPARPADGAAGIFSPEDRRALVNLGNNLNQIARAKNSGRSQVMDDQLADAIEKLDALFDRYLP